MPPRLRAGARELRLEVLQGDRRLGVRPPPCERLDGTAGARSPPGSAAGPRASAAARRVQRDCGQRGRCESDAAAATATRSKVQSSAISHRGTAARPARLPGTIERCRTSTEARRRPSCTSKVCTVGDHLPPSVRTPEEHPHHRVPAEALQRSGRRVESSAPTCGGTAPGPRSAVRTTGTTRRSAGLRRSGSSASAPARSGSDRHRRRTRARRGPSSAPNGGLLLDAARSAGSGWQGGDYRSDVEGTMVSGLRAVMVGRTVPRKGAIPAQRARLANTLSSGMPACCRGGLNR